MTSDFSRAAARVAAGADHHAEAAQLVASMTLDEQLDALDGGLPFWPGLLGMMSGDYHRRTWPGGAVPRLGVAGIEFADGPRGCVLGDSTAFPVSMARGATFDPDLEERIGEAIGAELRVHGATITGAVCMNLLRHPAWGRAQETYGEEPHHVGEMAAALTRGLQRHVMACMKHFALNSMENARFLVDVRADERALHEVYLPHFERVAAEGVASTMSAYNSVNGEWCGENATLLTEILRDEWGWDGLVISDFIFGLRDAVASVQAGLDIEMPFRQQRAVHLADAVADGRLDLADVEAAVGRIVATLLRFAPLFDTAPPESIVGCDEHRTLAHDAAVAATVMVHNEALLPVDADAVRKVAVLGRLAAVRNLGDGGSSDVRSSRVVTPLAGVRAAFPDAEVVHHDDDVSIVEGADLVVVVVGYTKDDEGEYIDTAGTAGLIEHHAPPADHPTLGISAAPPRAAEAPSDSEPVDPGLAPGGDRRSLRLSDADEALIAAATAAHQDVVVSVVAGSAVVMPWLASARAVLMSWYSGVEGGTALGDVLTGRTEPGGRLPFAVPFDEHDLVDFDPDASVVEYGLFHGQWHLDRTGVDAQLPFGWGLGYTTFAVDVGTATAVDDEVAVRVTNTGGRAGSTVVFVHAGLPDSSVERPEHRLVGFARVHADAGEEIEVAIEIDWSMLDVRREGEWWTEPGTYRLTVGRHAHDPDAVVLQVERPSR